MPDDNTESKLVGRPGAAAILGVSRQRVQAIENRPGFPKPYDHLEDGRPVWRRKAIERYKTKRATKALA